MPEKLIYPDATLLNHLAVNIEFHHGVSLSIAGTVELCVVMGKDLVFAYMEGYLRSEVTFNRLTEIKLSELVEHMSDSRIAEHMPLLTYEWNVNVASDFVAKKEESWTRDGLGHWAFIANGKYVGWGGFQKEGDEWDFGLVLRPDTFGLGAKIARKAIEFAKADNRIPFVTFLLPTSRKNLGALRRLGAKQIGRTNYEGAEFFKFHLKTS